MELKSPKLHTPGKLSTCQAPHPKMQESRYFQPQPHPTMWLRRGPGCHRPSNPWAVSPNSPHRPAPTCRAGPQSPVSRHSLPHSGERVSECNEATGTTSFASWWGPAVQWRPYLTGTLAFKKEYCRCGPHPLQVTSSRARPPLVKGAGCIGPLFPDFRGWPLWFMASIALRGLHKPCTGGCSWCLIALWGSLTWVWEGTPGAGDG